MNWKSYVEKKNAKTFVIPDGWDSRDEVANQLDCSPEKVDDHLRPAIKSGEVIKQQFKVWDDGLKRLNFVVAYRETSKDKKGQELPEPTDIPTIQRLKKEGKTYAEIGAAVGRSGDSVRGILRRSA